MGPGPDSGDKESPKWVRGSDAPRTRPTMRRMIDELAEMCKRSIRGMYGENQLNAVSTSSRLGLVSVWMKHTRIGQGCDRAQNARAMVGY